MADQVTLTVKEDGPRTVLTASRPDDGKGLYKAWLAGPGGRFLLGTMVPEGGSLVVKRTVSRSELQRCGAWPAEGVEAELAFAFPGSSLPPGWRGLECAGGIWSDASLERMVQNLSGALLYTDRGGFFLAAPYDAGKPFALTALFCFASVETLGQGDYAVFCFDRAGRPCFSHNGHGSVTY